MKQRNKILTDSIFYRCYPLYLFGRFFACFYLFHLSLVLSKYKYKCVYI